LTQNIGTNYTVTIPTLSDDASIVEAFKYYHTGALTGSIEENSIEYHITALGDQSDTIDTNLGYSGVSPTPSSVHARLNSLESTVGTSLASTYIKAIPSSNNTASTRNLIQPSTSSVIPLAIQGVVGQTADLQQWKTSAATVAKITSTGAVYSYDGTSMAEVTTLSGTQTLTNKTLTNPISTIGSKVKSSSFLMALSDQSYLVECSSSLVPVNITIPDNAAVPFPIGTYVVFLQTGAANFEFFPQAGVTLNYTPGKKSRTQWSMVTLIKRGTDSWVAAGDLTS